MRTTLIHSNSSASLASLPSRSQLGSLAPDGSSSTAKFPSPPREGKCRQLCQNTFRRKNLERVFPIIKWLPLYDGRKAVADAIAGVTVGLTVLAQGLAYATVAGLPPIYGLYSAFAGCFVYIFLGSTRQITIGPTAIVSVLTSKYVFGKPPQYAVFLSAVTAVVTTLMAVLRLGFIANFISRPVISGFTSAVALTIVATQLGPHLGLKLHKEGFLPTIEGIIENWHECREWDMILSAICISLLLFMKKLEWVCSPVTRRSAVLAKLIWFVSTCRSVFVLFGATGISYALRPEMANETHMFSIVGHVPPGIPTFQLPPFRIFDPTTNSTHTFTDILSEEASALIVIPLLAIVEHITIARAFAGPNRVDATQEILTIGISNCISCFFQSYPIAGCFSRTTVNGFSGVETPMGGLYTGVIVLLALQFLTADFYYIPKAALASVITSSVIFMVEPDIIKPLWRSKPMDMIPWGITFLVTLLVGLEFGILVGLCISTLYLLYYAARPRVKVLEAETIQGGTKFILIALDRSLTFPSVDYITYQVGKSVRRFGQKNTPAVIDCHHIQYTDFTAAEAMKSMLDNLHEQGYHLIFYRMKPSMLRIVQGVMDSPAEGSPPFIHCGSESDLETLIDGGKWKGMVNSSFEEVVAS